MSPIQRYYAAIEAGVLIADSNQESAVLLLQECYEGLVAQCGANERSIDFDRDLAQKELEQALQVELKQLQQQKKHLSSFQYVGWIKKISSIWSNRSEVIGRQQSLGCYIYGGVGRGKTLFMDYFYESLPLGIKAKRTHFHRFMREVHSLMHQLAGVENPLQLIGNAYAEVYDIICLDEFVVIDITDAMLLSGLTQSFFDKGLMLITTSNAPPAELYKDGLQRARFLPAIKNLELFLQVHYLDSNTDYRLRHLVQNPTYMTLNEKQSVVFKQIFRDLSGDVDPSPGTVQVNGRALHFCGCYTDIIWFDFSEICGSMRSVSDYIELAKEFHTVLISNVPQLTSKREDWARRFVHLVDEFYDTKVKLILGAAVNIEDLYSGVRVSFEFERTRSRLIEMQSEAYLAECHQS